ncbi:hypothetical protein, partial [Nocardioides sp. GCM10030258]|uniref:hypothetical protein n=1 Tax=unclassified Nocardioides TaxID=2615069 RepID=UPI00360782B1
MGRVYDFEGDHGAGGAGGSGAPHRALLLLELPRWTVEYGSSRLIDLAAGVLPDRDLGQGRPVLVLPGFSAHDKLTGRLR